MLRRFWRSTFFQPFLDGDGGTGSGGAGTGGGGDGAGSGGAGDGGGQGGKEGQPFATFPDEASFNARLKREGKAQLDNLAKSMGFESADAMQAAAKSKKESDDAAKSDLEKEKARANKAEADGKTALEQANQRVINSEIKVFASQAGFVDPADAVSLVERTGIQVDEQGNVKGAKEAVEALAKAKPHLVGTGKSPGGPGSAGNGGRQTGKGEEGTELATRLGQKQAETTKGQVENPYFK